MSAKTDYVDGCIKPYTQFYSIQRSVLQLINRELFQLLG